MNFMKRAHWALVISTKYSQNQLLKMSRKIVILTELLKVCCAKTFKNLHTILKSFDATYLRSSFDSFVDYWYNCCQWNNALTQNRNYENPESKKYFNYGANIHFRKSTKNLLIFLRFFPESIFWLYILFKINVF